MARRLRLEFPGALYHVLNRGNYRRPLFQAADEAHAFLRTLEEAVSIYDWRLQAFAVMPNHYHLAVETPEANLVDGMHWLQSTFATRFNRLHKESGHLFQGRYQSLLVEDDSALARLVNYIHLNPVRAGLVTPEYAGTFRWGSLMRFIRGICSSGLVADRWLKALGLRPDDEGWSDYLDLLKRLASDRNAQDEAGFSQMSSGWAIGTKSWRQALAEKYATLSLDPGRSAAELHSFRESRWANELNRLLEESGRTAREAVESPKGASWKVAIAAELRQRVGAPVKWIARSLSMGSPDAVRGYLFQYRSRKSS